MKGLSSRALSIHPQFQGPVVPEPGRQHKRASVCTSAPGSHCTQASPDRSPSAGRHSHHGSLTFPL